jgi:hypothetical protein
MKSKAPIVLFVYNRHLHTRRTVEALEKNDLVEESDLFIFSDAPKSEDAVKDVDEVRRYIKTIGGFKSVTIIEREENLGLAKSIVSGVTEIIDRFGRIIVLEDDMVTSTNFLKFANEALEFYRYDLRISAISGYTYPIEMPDDYNQDVYISLRGSPWGWASWKDRWDKIDWEVENFEYFIKDKETRRLFSRLGDDLIDRLVLRMKGKIDAWSIIRTASQFKSNEYTLYPTVSKVMNIGCDSSGVNFRSNTSDWDVNLDTSGKETTFVKDIQPDERINEIIRNKFSYKFRNKVVSFLKRNLIL